MPHTAKWWWGPVYYVVSSGTARECGCYHMAGMKRHGSPTQPPDPLWWEDSLGYSCWWCLAEVSWLFSKTGFSVLLGSPFPGTFARDSRLLFGLFFFFFVCTCLYPRLWASSAHSLWYKKQKENPENLPPFCSLGLEVPSQSPFLSHLSESSYACFMNVYVF